MTENAKIAVKGNAEISQHGRIYAAKVRDAAKAKLDAVKLEIEAEIRRGESVEGGRLTAQAILYRAGLKPHYLHKPVHKDLNASLRIWIDQQNARIGLATRRPSTKTDDKLALDGLREDFLKLQRAYAKDSLAGINLSRTLHEERFEMANLKAENASLRQRLRAAGLSDAP